MCIFFKKYKKKYPFIQKLDDLKVNLLKDNVINDIDLMIDDIFREYYVMVTNSKLKYKEYICNQQNNHTGNYKNNTNGVKFSTLIDSLNDVIVEEIIDFYNVDRVKSFIYIIIWWYLLVNNKYELGYINIKYDEVCRTATVKYFVYDDIEMVIRLVKL